MGWPSWVLHRLASRCEPESARAICDRSALACLRHTTKRASPMSMSSHLILYVGLDVHKETVVIAVLPAGAEKPTRVDRVPNDPKVLRRFFARLAEEGEIRACYEA